MNKRKEQTALQVKVLDLAKPHLQNHLHDQACDLGLINELNLSDINYGFTRNHQPIAIINNNDHSLILECIFECPQYVLTLSDYREESS